MTNQLESLRRHSVIVADTGDIDAIARFQPQDATTNPSLILKAAQEPRYQHLIEAAMARGGPAGAPTRRMSTRHGPAVRRVRPRDPHADPGPRLDRGGRRG